MPASEALLDEETIKRFRSRYREKFGATATQDPLYQALSDGRRMAGMEHWLPLLEERLDDPVRPSRRERPDPARRRRRPGARGAARGDRGLLRRTATGRWRPSRAATARSSPTTLYLPKDGMGRASSPSGRSTSPRPSPSPKADRIIDFGVEPARDFAPERAQQANVYEAVAEHVANAAARAAARSCSQATRSGARERLRGLLEDHGLKAQKLADSWQEALGAKTQPALLVLPLDHGFTTPDVAVLTEQDMLGDRLVRRRKKRKAAAAFLAELATLSPGDLVVHADHGIGRYEGLTQIPVGKAPHDCVALEYARRRQALRPGREYRAADRATAARARASTLDSLGGEAWQRRKSRMKERIREIAGELIKTAALRATRPGVVAEPDASYPAVRRPLPLRGNRRPGPRDRGRARRPRSGQADGPAGVRRRRLRQDRGRAARRVRHGDVGQAGRADLPDHPARAPALHAISSSGFRASRSRSGGCRGWSPRPRRRRPRKASPTAQVDIVIGTHALLAKAHQVQAPGPGHRRRGAAFRSRPQGAAEGAARPTSTC